MIHQDRSRLGEHLGQRSRLRDPLQDLVLAQDGEARCAKLADVLQRSLEALAAAGKVEPLGRGRARRWMTPPSPGFTTALLLPSPLPGA